MNTDYIPEYRRLKNAGWDVSKKPAVRFNAGGSAETVGHIVAKTLTAKLCLENGYMIDTEVEHPNYGEIDVLCYHPERLNWAIELETEPDEETKQDKIERYVYGTEPINDLCLVDVSSLPAHCLDMRDRLLTKLDFL
jgi:hypothetical protein